MVASPDDPFESNPYSAPEMQEHVELDRATTVPGSVWKWLVVAVVIEATHGCMTGRGVRTPDVVMKTSRMMGVFRDDEKSRKEVLRLMGL